MSLTTTFQNSAKEAAPQQGGVPFHYDAPTPGDLDDLINDPAVQEILEASDADILIISQEDVQAMINNIDDPALKEKISNPPIDWEEVLDDKHNINCLLDAIKEHNPRIYNTMKAAILDGEPWIHDPFESYGDYVNRAKTETITNVFSPNANFVLFREGQPLNLHNMGGTPGHSDTFLMKLERPDMPPSELVSDMFAFANVNFGESSYNDPPGTSAQWNAFVFMHELEHFADHSQSPLEQHFGRLRQEGMNSGSYNALMGVANETEADIGAMEALEGQVPPEVFEYWAAFRISIGSQNRFNEAPFDDPTTEEVFITPSNRFGIDDSHETGFFVQEYLNTGHPPTGENFMATIEAMEGFYTKVKSHIASKIWEEAQEIKDPPHDEALYVSTINDIYDDLPQDMVLGAVHDALAADPPILTPEEEQIAQMYIQAVEGTMGVEPQNINNYAQEILQEKVQESAPATPTPDPDPDPQSAPTTETAPTAPAVPPAAPDSEPASQTTASPAPDPNPQSAPTTETAPTAPAVPPAALTP